MEILWGISLGPYQITLDEVGRHIAPMAGGTGYEHRMDEPCARKEIYMPANLSWEFTRGFSYSCTPNTMAKGFIYLRLKPGLPTNQLSDRIGVCTYLYIIICGRYLGRVMGADKRTNSGISSSLRWNPTTDSQATPAQRTVCLRDWASFKYLST